MLTSESLPWLQDYVEPVNSALDELNRRNGSTALENAVVEALSTGGKRMRATLALLWCEVYSGDYRQAIPLVVAYELAHASALVQADIIDRSEMRRKGSVVAKYGLTTAILASDLLLFNVPKMVTKYRDLESWKLARIFDFVGEASRATTWGEFIDMEIAQGREDGTEVDYEEMVRLKTSSLLSAPCASGALVGGASEDEAALAGRFGEELGVAYQIQGDTPDLIRDESVLGKPVFNDLKGGKKSLVLLHCMRKCTEEERGFVSDLLNRPGAYTEDEISKLRRLIEDSGSLEYARQGVMRHTAAASDLLGSAPENGAKSRLLELVDYLAARHY